jgi:hypothetical protein
MHIDASMKHPLFGNVGRLPRPELGDADGQVPEAILGGQDVVWVAVEVLTGSGVPGRGARRAVGIGVADGSEHGRAGAGRSERVRAGREEERERLGVPRRRRGRDRPRPS